MSTLRPAADLALEVRQHFEDRGIVGSSAIAKEARLGQTQVHRNLYGRPKRVSRTLTQLCKYAQIQTLVTAKDPRENVTLMAALAGVWDGSETHAKKLAKLLRAHQSASI